MGIFQDIRMIKATISLPHVDGSEAALCEWTKRVIPVQAHVGDTGHSPGYRRSTRYAIRYARVVAERTPWHCTAAKGQETFGGQGCSVRSCQQARLKLSALSQTP